MIGRIQLLIFIIIFWTVPVFAGPPFQTDDPVPVQYQHWEIYVASQGSFDTNGKSLTAPHIEVNYGIVPEVQLHLIAPLVYAKSEGEASHYGYGDTEIGMKWRFVHETDTRPQIGIFPLCELPTGNSSEGLGSGNVDAFLPVWIQKTWETWTSYGGGGYWINPGSGNKNYWFVGWEAEHEITESLSIGGEVFHQTPSEKQGDSSTGFNVGAMVNLSDLQHLLFSAGRDFSGPNDASYYAAYQLTFGP